MPKSLRTASKLVHDNLLHYAGLVLPLLTPREAALDNFLSALLGAEDIVKAGFAFNGDLRNLCRSFPQLPCLGRNFLSSESLVGPPPLTGKP